MSSEFQPKIIGIVCNWCCYAGADLCGVSRFQYPPYIRLMRVMCSGRVDLLHILRAFSDGHDGMFIGGCHLGDCHYVSSGNFNAYGLFHVARKILDYIGLNPKRLRLEWVSAGEGIEFSKFMNEFGREIEETGPLGKTEGLDDDTLRFRLTAVKSIAPYVKLVLTHRLNTLERTEKAYYEFFDSDEFERFFQDSIAVKIVMSQIMLLLKNVRLSQKEISEKLGISPSSVAKYMNDSSRLGLVRYDQELGNYALA
ncbi:MAG: hydrogenase iron-sulfur subunit [Deltaproteobacteria bacterium]|nr:hydrogenase iron-sulfur subunit [Deltaproteobacteria bacterium]